MTVRQYARRMRAALGLPGLAGLVALVGAAGGYGWAVQPLHGQLDRMEAAVSAAEAAARTQPAPRGGDAGARLRTYLGSFPARATLNDWVEKIDAAAQASGTTVERVDYRPGSTEGMVSYQIVLPVKGSYAQVRTFVGTLLETLPSLAITGLELQREGPSSGAVAGRLQATLFLGGGER